MNLGCQSICNGREILAPYLLTLYTKRGVLVSLFWSVIVSLSSHQAEILISYIGPAQYQMNCKKKTYSENSQPPLLSVEIFQ